MGTIGSPFPTTDSLPAPSLRAHSTDLTPTILLVEDQPDVRDSTAMLLELWGCAVKCAANGKEALGELDDGFRPDIAILDLMMPVMDGLDFLKTLRAREADTSSHIRVLLVTASGDSERLDAAKALSDNYLSKPVIPEELKGLLTGMAV